MTKYSLFFITLVSITTAQTKEINGRVSDAETDKPLGYASILIDGTNTGTSANNDGIFRLKLEPGSYNLIFSYIGYKSDTLAITVPTGFKIEKKLEPQAVKLQEVVVNADENPAYRIIREAIKRKKENKKGLVNYEYKAYSKRIALSAGEVAAIEEVFLKGYCLVNKWTREFVLSTHKTENRKKEISVDDFSLTSDYYFDFSADTLPFLNSIVYLPLHDKSFDYYDYKLLKTTETENGYLYSIQVIPRSNIQPLIEGEITIESKNYCINSVNIRTNDGVRFPYINDLKVKFIQRLGKYGSYWLPYYVETNARASLNLGGLLSVDSMSFTQINTITEYNINKPIPDSVKNAVSSKYGHFTASAKGKRAKPIELTREQIEIARPIPLTGSEVEAYANLDSTKTIEKMVKVGGALSAFVPELIEEKNTEESFLEKSWETISTYGHFRNNRVNGILFGLKYNGKLISDKLDASASTGFSFLRDKIEWGLQFRYNLNKPIVSVIEAEVYEQANMWQIFTPYPDMLNSFGVTVGFDDQFNYYLAKGVNIGFGKNFNDLFSAKLNFTFEKQSSLTASKHKNVFNSNRIVRENPAIREGADIRSSIFMKFGKNPMELQLIPESGLIAQFDFSDPVLQSDFSYRLFRVIGMLKTSTFYKELFIAPYLQLTIDAGAVGGDFSIQRILTPNSACGFYSPPGVFKGLKPYQFVGTEMIALHIEHNWRTIPFQSLGLKFISNLHLDLITGVSGLKMWNSSNHLHNYNMTKPYWEAFVGLSRILAVFRLDFAYNSLQQFSVRAAMSVIF